MTRLFTRGRARKKMPADVRKNIEKSDLVEVAGGRGDDAGGHGRKARHDPPRQSIDTQDNGTYPEDRLSGDIRP